MARFARIDSQIRAHCLILANRFRVLELNSFLANRAFGRGGKANRRFCGDSRESLARYEDRGFYANRFARIDSRESPRFALRIAGSSKLETMCSSCLGPRAFLQSY